MTHYHISQTPNITTLEPRAPADPAIFDCEPLVARVCAAPTIWDCLDSIAYKIDYQTQYVYRIDTPPDVDNEGVINWPDAPPGWKLQGDAADTREVWYLSPVKCVCIGTVDDEGTVTQ